MIEPGTILNERYKLIKTLGEGGMANVYLARDLILDRDVAVKVLRLDLQMTPIQFAAFNEKPWRPVSWFIQILCRFMTLVKVKVSNFWSWSMSKALI